MDQRFDDIAISGIDSATSQPIRSNPTVSQTSKTAFEEALARYGSGLALQHAVYDPSEQPRPSLLAPVTDALSTPASKSAATEEGAKTEASYAAKTQRGAEPAAQSAIHLALPQEPSAERKAQINQWINENATADARFLGMHYGSVGGKRLSDALNGDSFLKQLTPAEQSYLIRGAAEKWQQNGDTKAIREAASSLKSSETRAIVAEAYATPSAETLGIHAHGGTTVSTPQGDAARYEMLKTAANTDRDAALHAFKKVESGLGRIILQGSDDSKPGWKVAPQEMREAGFVLRHPSVAARIGRPVKGETNISTDAVRFSTNELGLKENESHEGSQVNAFRHVLWQGQITSEFGTKIATEIGNAHENNPYAVQGFQDYQSKRFDTLSKADETIDLLNNRIGRKIGAAHPNASMKEIAQAALEHYRKEGLWVAERQSDGKYKLVQERLPEAQYERAAARLAELDENGFALDDKRNERAK